MELIRALAALAEPPTEETSRLADALALGPLPSADEYTQLFVFQLYPYASVYLGSEGMLGGEARDRIAGFWRALNQVPPAEPDHLSVMLALYAQLVEIEEAEQKPEAMEARRNARKAFLWEHLLSWLPVYLSKLCDCASEFYQRWGSLLMDLLKQEAAIVGFPSALPLHFREAPGLADPRFRGVDNLIQSLLAPVRSGIIITRQDMAVAGRRLGVGTRMGERRFMLSSLLGQDASGVFGWLIEEAERWTTRHHSLVKEFGEVGGYWEGRAAMTAELLAELKISSEEVI